MSLLDLRSSLHDSSHTFGDNIHLDITDIATSFDTLPTISSYSLWLLLKPHLYVPFNLHHPNNVIVHCSDDSSRRNFIHHVPVNLLFVAVAAETLSLLPFNQHCQAPLPFFNLGSKDGDVCVVEVKRMEVSHWSKRLHLGSCIAMLDFCPTERVVLSTSTQWGAMITKLNVPADWKEWQIYLLLLGLFLASAVAFYVFFKNSDSFWKFPLGKNQPARPTIGAILDPQSDDQWGAFGPLDL
ncbi:hypothetical protein RJ639_023606 [Escallonia herrerae]|uniref:Uncharacterized protein n=1 Tax=Escallonia herrerae TaxID=1293975 RepID=A0AA89ADW1_9ASTE|nr:hypothetical protein RJ639_023606 [Escallonia herrerae]